jgi:hypothetical protein
MARHVSRRKGGVMAKPSPAQYRKIILARRHGVPWRIATALLVGAGEVDGISPALALAVCEQESGFRNVWGHDPEPNGGTSGVGGRVVTKARYAAYKQARGSTGRGGMQGVGPMQLCVSPDTRILTSSLEWLPAESVVEGQGIVAFDEEGVAGDSHPKTLRRYFRTANVEAMKVETMERVRVITDQRELVVTPNHPILTWRPERYTWCRAEHLGVGAVVPSVPVWEADKSYGSGYLAGQFDGEGCFTVGKAVEGRAFSRLLWSQTADSPDIPHVRAALEERGFETRWHKRPARGWAGAHSTGRPVAAISIGGSWLEQARFIGSTRPRRMLRHPRLSEMWEQRQLNGCGRDTVVAVEPMTPGPMVAHQTTTRTLLTEGLLSHNTWWQFQDRADKAGGCWRVEANIRVALHNLGEMVRARGEEGGLAVYNGGPSNPNLQYAHQVINGRGTNQGRVGWHAILNP